jgi:very-short-patch-repair endonuclease
MQSTERTLTDSARIILAKNVSYIRFDCECLTETMKALGWSVIHGKPSQIEQARMRVVGIIEGMLRQANELEKESSVEP